MHSITFTSASALILFAASVQAKHSGHEHLEAIHRRHRHERELARQANETLVRRGICAFPKDAGLVAVTPGAGNAGWAFAPDQTCTSGRYCPYACPPGQVSMQWDPSVTSYVYPGSRNGGLLCNPDGSVTKPFPNRPYCQSTTANIGVQNDCGGKNIAFCQTVLPGDEDMLIPTDVTYWAKLAVPDTTYWVGSAAHYYINPPGVSSAQGCIWGSNANPHGNWAPYVAGANTDASGQTFIKLGWNPIYLETTTPFRNNMPTWGVRIECPNGGCTGLPCSIDPSKNKVNQMSGSSSSGAGGGTFCVVGVNKGMKANFVVFDNDPGKSQTWSSTNSTQGGRFYDNNATSTTSSPSSSSTSNQGSSSSSNKEDTSGTLSSFSEGPSGKPQYQLFNSTAPISTTVPSNQAVGSTQTTTNSLVAQRTGSASSIEISFVVMMLGLGAMLL